MRSRAQAARQFDTHGDSISGERVFKLNSIFSTKFIHSLELEEVEAGGKDNAKDMALNWREEEDEADDKYHTTFFAYKFEALEKLVFARMISLLSLLHAIRHFSVGGFGGRTKDMKVS